MNNHEVDMLLRNMEYEQLKESRLLRKYILALEDKVQQLSQKPEVKTTYIYHYYAKIQDGSTFDGLYTSGERVDSPNTMLTLKRLIIEEANKDGFAIKGLEELALCSLTFLHTIEEPCK